MYYVYVEDSKIISILDYEATVPSTVSTVVITDEQYASITGSQPTHKFDTTSMSVVSLSSEILSSYEVQKENQRIRELLNNTDWKVLRHIREKTLGVTTTMTEEEYVALETERQTLAKSIV